MAHKLAALWLASALGGAAPAFADPPAFPDGQTCPAAPEAGTPPPAKPLWGKGQILPPEYRRASLNDWDRYGLPPRQRRDFRGVHRRADKLRAARLKRRS